MLFNNHDLCVLNAINAVNAHSKSNFAKKNSKRKVWKPTGKVFTKTGYTWRPIEQTFTIVGNAFPLTRITTTTKVPLRKLMDLETYTPKPVVTLVYSRKPRKSKTDVPVWKLKIIKYKSANNKEPNSGCSKHMTRDRSELTNFVNKFLGTVKFKNDHVAKIMGYGDYHIGNVTISRVYYVEGLGHNLFSIGKFCYSNLEVAFRQHTCFIHNLEGVDLLTGSCGNILYTVSGRYDVVLSYMSLVKASKTKSWLLHQRLSHLNFGTINHLARHEAVATACYIQNCSIIHIHHGKTPYELLHDKLHDLSFFYVFVALCYPTNDSEDLGKLQPKADIAPEVIASIAEVVALEPVASTGSPSSTTVDQDAPSTSNSQTTPKIQSPFISNDVDKENHDLDVADMNNDPFFGVEESLKTPTFRDDLLHKSLHEDSTSQ
nr:integrase, catalytic region, zinc finger, CCHC-type, peptidase aspartic, catalytic [Tanacetum cinerariifolium]